MKAQRKGGRGESEPTRAVMLGVLLLVLGCAGTLEADTVWLSGHHEIGSGDVYGEIYMYNGATATMVGGDVFKLEAFDITGFDMLDGVMTDMRIHDDSTANLYAGGLNRVGITENGSLNLYAYDVIYHPTGGHYDRGWLEGTYVENDSYFSFDFVEPDTYQHINIVPEPISAIIDIQPDTLNLSSKGKWLTCHIYLPEDYNVADVNSETVFLDDEIPADWVWFEEEEQVAMAKFRRSEVKEIVEPGVVELTVNGYLVDGSYFEGTDIIKVMDKGGRKD
jgi:hypothetical protein